MKKNDVYSTQVTFDSELQKKIRILTTSHHVHPNLSHCIFDCIENLSQISLSSAKNFPDFLTHSEEKPKSSQWPIRSYTICSLLIPLTSSIIHLFTAPATLASPILNYSWLLNNMGVRSSNSHLYVVENPYITFDSPQT